MTLCNDETPILIIVIVLEHDFVFMDIILRCEGEYVTLITPFDISVGIEAYVIGLGQISSFLS